VVVVGGAGGLAAAAPCAAKAIAMIDASMCNPSVSADYRLGVDHDYRKWSCVVRALDLGPGSQCGLLGGVDSGEGLR
jgi:hypothetical protein